MVLRRSIFALAALLIFGTAMGCADDKVKEPNNPGETCEENPTQPKCDTGETCEENPDQPKCDTGESCEENPDQPKCDTGETCEENPDQDKCEAATRDADLYVTDLSAPQADENGDATCCLEVDGEYKNAFADTLADLAGELGAGGSSDVFGSLLAEGKLRAVFQASDLPQDLSQDGDVTVSLHRFELQSGEPTIRPDSLADFSGALTGGVLEADADSLSIPWNAEVEDIPLSGELKISDVHLNAALSGEGDAVATDGSVADANGSPHNYVSGVIHGQDLLDMVNGVFQDVCADLTDGPLVIDQSTPTDDHASVTLDQDAMDALQGSTDASCGLVYQLLTNTSDLGDKIAQHLDVDTDEDGVADGFSFGLNVQLNTERAISCKEDVTQAKCQTYTYLSNFALPDPPTDCCYDYNGDGDYNNALASVLPLVGALTGIPNFDAGVLVNAPITAGTLNPVFHAVDYPLNTSESQSFTLDLYNASSQSDISEKAAGNGVYTIGDMPIATFDAQNDAGVITATSDALPVQLDLTAIGGGNDSILMTDVRLNAVVDRPAYNSLSTEAGEFLNDDGNAINFVTGAVSVDELTGFMSNLFSDMCDIDGALVITELDANGDPKVAVDTAVDAEFSAMTDENGDSTTCSQIGDLFSGTPLDIPALLNSPGFLDVDTDGNGVPDAYSLGLNFDLVGATVK